MADRRVLLIDTDKSFAETLRKALAPYGVSVEAVDDGSDGLGRVRDVNPELLIIAVELPKKEGYGLFSRAKKGAAKSLPVMLVTGSVGADDFAKHQKLSTHADEYVDKRTTSAAQLVQRIDALVQLGPAQAADMDLDVAVEEAEELSIDEDLAVVEEDGQVAGGTFGDEHTNLTTGVKDLVDDGIDAETDAAFAALGMDDPASHSGDGEAFDLDDGGSTALLPVSPADVPDGNAMAPAGDPDATDDAINEFGVEIPMTAAAPAMVAAHDPEPAAEAGVPEPLPEAEPEAAFVPEEAAPAPEAAASPAAPAARKPATVPPPTPAAAFAKTPPTAPAPASTEVDEVADEGLDLGLEEVASKVTPQSAVAAAEDPRLGELRAEVERLNTELAAARAAAPAGGGAGSREREFKNLREMISRKEKELDDLQGEIEAKDKQIQQGKDKLKDLDKKLREAEHAGLKSQEDLVTANAQIQTLTHDKDKGLEREKGLKARLDASQTEVRKAHDEITALKNKLASDGNAAAEALANVKAERDRAAQAHENERKANEAAHAQKVRELEEAGAAALRSLQEELEGARAVAVAAVESDRAERLAALAKEHEIALAALRDEHTGEIAALHTAHEQALAQKDREGKAALAKAAEEREQALSAAEERRKADLADADERRQHELAEQAKEHAAATAALEKKHTDDLTALAAERRSDLAAAEQRRVEQLAEAEERRTKDLADAEARRVKELAEAEDRRTGELAAVTTSFESEREEQKSAHDAAVAALRGEIAGLEEALRGAREQIAGLEGDLAARRSEIAARDGQIGNLSAEVADRDGQLAARKAEIADLEQQNAQLQEQVLRAYQKIKSDEAIVQKAKKAMAIALTLLDENKAEAGKS